MNDHLHNVLGGRPVVEGIRPTLVERGCLVDIDVRFGCSLDERNEVIFAMLDAGYHLRGEQLTTLTFLKEMDT